MTRRTVSSSNSKETAAEAVSSAGARKGKVYLQRPEPQLWLRRTLVWGSASATVATNRVICVMAAQIYRLWRARS